LGIGVDAIPNEAIDSGVFTGNELGILGNVEQLPSEEEILAFSQSEPDMRDILTSGNNIKKFEKAKKYLAENNVPLAWKTILAK
jgi:hypothetical protein